MKFDAELDYQFSWNDNRRGRVHGCGGIAVAADGTILVVDRDGRTRLALHARMGST